MEHDPNKELEELFKNDVTFTFSKKMYESNPESKAWLDIFRKYGMSDDNSILALMELMAVLSANANNKVSENELSAKLNRVFNKVEVVESKINKAIRILESK